MGDILERNGCQLDDFRRNRSYWRKTIAIGLWPSILVKGGRLDALAEFATNGVSAVADEYCSLAKAGTLAARFAFNPKKSGPDHAVPVIFFARADSARWCVSCQGKPSSSTSTS